LCSCVGPAVAVLLSVVDVESGVARVSALVAATIDVDVPSAAGVSSVSGIPAIAGLPAVAGVTILLLKSLLLMVFLRFWRSCCCQRPLMFNISIAAVGPSVVVILTAVVSPWDPCCCIAGVPAIADVPAIFGDLVGSLTCC
jgi:hypothetical protein